MYTYNYTSLNPKSSIAPVAPRFIAESWSDSVWCEADYWQAKGYAPYSCYWKDASGKPMRMHGFIFTHPYNPVLAPAEFIDTAQDKVIDFPKSTFKPFITAREASYNRKPAIASVAVAAPPPAAQIASAPTPALPEWAASLNTPVQMVKGSDLQPRDEVYFGAHAMGVRLKARNGDNGRNPWGDYMGWDCLVMYYGTDGTFFPAKRQVNPNRYYVTHRQPVASVSTPTAQGA